jgi:hypothetical protein
MFAPSMGGSGGKASACRFPYAPVCKSRYLPLTRFAAGRGLTAYGGRIVRQSKHALPGQPLTQQHPLFARAGSRAAELWLESFPLSAGEFRDLRFRNLAAGLGAFDGDDARRDAFNTAFAGRIALAIVQPEAGVRHG